jgi:hypothetical protein
VRLLLVAAGATVALAAVVVLAVLLRPADLTAEETARALRHSNPHWRDVHCIPGSNGWDYTCSYKVSFEGRDLRESIGVDVDSESPTHVTAP